MNLTKTLNYEFWKYFKEISSIPRKSGEEQKIAKYLINFANERNLKYYSDKYNNVIIWKEASPGYEHKETLGLQCHTDMICEKTKNSEHDFSKDALDLIVDGDYIKAKNTTLGADNGIGVAYILAIINSSKILTPKLECIFTTEEETTMNGVNYLDATVLESKKIISFDNFSEDEMWISSATAKEWVSTITQKQIELTHNNYSTYSLNLTNFKGGHAGLDIGDNTRGNPIKICAELLKGFSNIYIVNFAGGTKVNIIPRNCEIQFTVNNNELYKLSILKENIKKIQKEYKDVNVSCNKIDTIVNCYDNISSKKILDFINTFRNGAIVRDEYENVILSGNFAAVKSEKESITISYSIRYNSNKIGNELEKEIKDNMKLYNIKIKKYTNILGYEQDENSKLIKECENLYFKHFNKNIKKIRVQACLESGYLYSKIPDLQYISIAPNIYDAHSPYERMSIKSANKMWEFIIQLIQNIDY